MCETKATWDVRLNNTHLQHWRKWEQQLPQEQQIPQSIMNHKEVEEVELHTFGDASTHRVGAAVYAVIWQYTSNTQRLVAAEGQVAKQGLTIPRLEFIALHMATNLLVNVRNTLNNLPTLWAYAWLDSMVVLHWIKGNGQYKQFTANWGAKNTTAQRGPVETRTHRWKLREPCE